MNDIKFLTHLLCLRPCSIPRDDSPVTRGWTTVTNTRIKMPFTRPPHLTLPTTWRRFTTDRGPLRIQDLTEDLWEQAVDLLTAYFMKDEPPCRFIEIHKHPTAVAELQKLWRSTLKDNLSLACVVDNDDLPPRIVGLNVLTVVCKEDKEEPFQTEDKVWAQLFGAVDLVSHSVDIFSQYNVDKYLTAYGLVVDPEWRGRNVGKELLLARIPLCKALGVKVTATVFTAGASQAVAKKAGFEDLFEITYEELAKKGFVFPGIEKDTKSSKMMAMVI
ncbi:arylalkylamine N-acetyltransferase-like 2 [Anticarsia gemmatalis]|uniref:arylalkylamine N-acetyltransferase-like 2 n=1 Tax=Anticarsia gemmatalis TaxID=129554 RepID=UPI003F764BA0